MGANNIDNNFLNFKEKLLSQEKNNSLSKSESFSIRPSNLDYFFSHELLKQDPAQRFKKNPLTQVIEKTHKLFKNQLFITFSIEEPQESECGSQVIVAKGESLTKEVFQYIGLLFPNEFEYSACSSYAEMIYVISSRNLDSENQNKFIKALAACVLIPQLLALHHELKFFKTETNNVLFYIQLIEDLIKNISADKTITLSMAFEHYKQFGKLANEFLTGKLESGMHLLLNKDEQKKLKSVFSSLTCYGCERKEGLPGFLVSKTEKNALAFDKIPSTLNFLDKLSQVAEVELCKKFNMGITFAALAKAVSNDNNISLEQLNAIYEHFGEPLDAIIENRPLNIKRLIQSEAKMNRAFCGTLAINKTTQVALSGAKAAVKGFVVASLVLGVIAATVGTGGVGLLGVAAVTVIFSGLVGAAKGYQNACEAEKQHYLQKTGKRLAAHTRVYNNAGESVNSLFFPVVRIWPELNPDSMIPPDAVKGTQNEGLQNNKACSSEASVVPALMRSDDNNQVNSVDDFRLFSPARVRRRAENRTHAALPRSPQRG